MKVKKKFLKDFISLDSWETNQFTKTNQTFVENDKWFYDILQAENSILNNTRKAYYSKRVARLCFLPEKIFKEQYELLKKEFDEEIEFTKEVYKYQPNYTPPTHKELKAKNKKLSEDRHVNFAPIGMKAYIEGAEERAQIRINTRNRKNSRLRRKAALLKKTT